MAKKTESVITPIVLDNGEICQEPICYRDEEGLLHRDDGPALIDSDVQMWWQHGVIHREDGPAVEFPDPPHGNPEDNLYIIRGVGLCIAGFDIGRKIVMEPKSLSISEILGIKNEEVKIIAIERYGPESFLVDANAEVIDESGNDVEMTREALFKISDIVYFVGACRSTGRVYYIPVPSVVKTCDEARKFMSSGKELNKCVGAS
jgi:hypothetical protein